MIVFCFCYSVLTHRVDIHGVDADRFLRNPATQRRFGVSAEIGRLRRHRRLPRHGEVAHPVRSHLLRCRNHSVFIRIQHHLGSSFRHLRSVFFANVIR